MGDASRYDEERAEEDRGEKGVERETRKDGGEKSRVMENRPRFAPIGVSTPRTHRVRANRVQGTLLLA